MGNKVLWECVFSSNTVVVYLPKFTINGSMSKACNSLGYIANKLSTNKQDLIFNFKST